MDKKQKKELESKLAASISNLLAEINAEGAASITKTIKKKSQFVVRKFSKTVKKGKAIKGNHLPGGEK